MKTRQKRAIWYAERKRTQEFQSYLIEQFALADLWANSPYVSVTWFLKAMGLNPYPPKHWTLKRAERGEC